MRNKALNIAKTPEYDGYQRRLASMVYQNFNKKSKESGATIALESSKQLAEKLRKKIIRNFKKRTVYSR